MTTEEAPEREKCPHCGRHIPIQMIVDDLSGCPLVAKCLSPAGYLGAAAAWPVTCDDDDRDAADDFVPAAPAPVPLAA